MLVYKVTAPNGKCYIGITTKTIEFRKQKHYSELKNNNTNYKFHNAIRKYKNELCWEIIDNSAISHEHLKNLEIWYIQFFDSYNSGYNMTLGGDGTKGWYHTEESKNKMKGIRPKTSAALKGKNKSEEHKKHLSEARKKPGITDYMKTPEFRAKISLISKRNNASIEIRNNKAIVGGGKAFLVLKDDIIVGEWISQRQCARDLNLQQSCLGKCLRSRNINKKHKGYSFRYKEEQ